MNIDFTAATAKSLVADYDNLCMEKSRKEFLSVVDKISEVAREGKSVIYMYDIMSYAVANQLKLRGFLVSVNPGQHGDNDITTISWE